MVNEKASYNFGRFIIRFKRLVALVTFFLIFVGGELHAQSATTRAHDPVMIKQDDTYYLFSTGRGIRMQSSTDLENWERIGRVFDEAPEWTFDVNPDFRNHMWAPDITHHDGTYYLYYSVSTFGRNRSAIGVATTPTLNPDDPDYKWTDHGPVVQSFPGRDMWNAIDPNLAFDNEGAPWLTFGSYWMGIKLVKLQANLTDIARSQQEWHTLASRHRYWKLNDRYGGDTKNSDIEAPFIFKKNGYYYLFASWDRCCAGQNSTYKVVTGRSKNITGPYIDKANQDMKDGGGTLVVKGNEEWAAVGHQAAYTFDGTDYLVFHGYENNEDGDSYLLIKEIKWDKDGWPAVSLD